MSNKFTLEELLKCAGVLTSKKYYVRVIDRNKNICISDNELIEFYDIYDKVQKSMEYLKLDDWYFSDILLGHNNDIYIIAR